ncbi:DsbA family protein [Candidatus Woesearchaeota archaeon]|jgi:hypothetical protein|nr:DsbA family protein [Candidatus Woesearchaeota archaeon]MBT6520017.1 DsbA family protein [Candidatus Woesearchaeota archaeon]MBT7367736.1 DsbA family protein [Candidatus Woesearchaeota archaeon]
MICIAALVVFAIMAIFSVRYRPLAKEALDCVIRKTTFRKCKTDLDKRIKYKLTGRLLLKNKFLAKFIYHNFVILSYVFIILTIVSMVYVGIGGYNYYLYGNCNGPQDDGFCIFDPLGENSKVSEPDLVCGGAVGDPAMLTLDGIDLDLFPTFNADAKDQVVFVGCYGCTYTRDVYPAINKLLVKHDVSFVFAHYPVKAHTDFLTNYGNCMYRKSPKNFFKFNDILFEIDPENINEEVIDNILIDLGIDSTVINECVSSSEMVELHGRQLTEIEKMGVYGTPTIFVNSEAVVGPKPYRAYSKMLD